MWLMLVLLPSALGFLLSLLLMAFGSGLGGTALALVGIALMIASAGYAVLAAQAAFIGPSAASAEQRLTALARDRAEIQTSIDILHQRRQSPPVAAPPRPDAAPNAVSPPRPTRRQVPLRLRAGRHAAPRFAYTPGLRATCRFTPAARRCAACRLASAPDRRVGRRFVSAARLPCFRPTSTACCRIGKSGVVLLQNRVSVGFRGCKMRER